MHSLLRTLLFVGAVCAAAMATANPPPPDEVTRVKRIDALLKQYADAETFSGEVLVAQGDRVLLHERYGYRDWRTREALPVDGIFKTGSVTKQFTAAAVLRLEQKGLLATGDALSRHLPELPAALTAREGVVVTLHHLVTHTSGLPNPIFANVWGPEQGFPTLLAALGGKELRHTPGAEFHYNNAAYALLGEVIRRTSGETYEQFIRREFFEPMGMRRSGVKLDVEARTHAVRGHVRNTLSPVPAQEAFGRFVTGSHDWDLLANGNVSSTVTDLHRWVRGLQEGTVFPPDVMRRMLKAEQRGYAYGWIGKAVEGWDEPLYWHNGAIIPFGFTADVAWTSESKLCVIVLSNLDDTAVVSNAFDNVLRVLRGEPASPPRSGREVTGSYFTVQLLALLLGSPLVLVLFIAYLGWALVIRSPRSRLEALTTVAGVVSMGVLIAVVLGGVTGALGLAAGAALCARWAWRARGRPLLHAAPWKQWAMTAGSLFSSVAVLALAIFVASYF